MSIYRILRPLVALAAFGVACSPPAAPDELPPLTIEPDVLPETRSADFALTIDPQQPEFVAHKTLEPVASPITLTGGTSAISLRAFAKRLTQRPQVLWIELYVENKDSVGIRDVIVEASEVSGDKLIDLTSDPFAEDTSTRSLKLGALSAESIGRLVIGVPSDAKTTLKLKVRGLTTKRVAQSSTPITVTPDGSEVWVTWPDADLVAILDAKNQTKLGQLSVAGKPSSVTVTPDGKLVLVASAVSNTVTVIDRQSREVIQTLQESDGIGREPRHLVGSPDGSHVFVSAFVGDSITSLARHGSKYLVDGTISVGRRPVGMSVAPDGTLLVAHHLPRGKVTANEGYVSVLSTSPLVQRKEAVIHDPFNLKDIKCLTDGLMLPPELATSEGAPTQLAGAFLNPAGTQAWIPGGRLGPVPIWERGPKAQALSPFVAPHPGEIIAPFLFLLDVRSSSAVTTAKLPGVLDPPDVRLPYLRCAQLEFETEFIRRNLLTEPTPQQVNTTAATPTSATSLTESGTIAALTHTRGGRLLLGVAHTSDELVLYDAMSLVPRTQRHTPLSGSNPVGIALTPDGKKAFVVYQNSTFVSVLDTSAYAQPGQLPQPSYIPYEYRDVPQYPPAGSVFSNKRLVRFIASVPDRPAISEVGQVPLLAADPVDPVLRRGAVLFHSANPDKHPTLSASRLGSCASCHPGGHNDGGLWPTMEGERRTMSLRGGVSGRGWLHSSATHIDAAEFAEIIVKERLGGNLSKPDIAALAKYVAIGIPKIQGPKVDQALAQRGQALFAQKCSGCHSGAQLTSGKPASSDPLGGGDASGPLLFDIGTATDNAFVSLPKFVERTLPPLEKELITKLRGDRDLGTGDRVQEILDFRARPDRKRGQLKAPSLTNTWDNVLYFHDGRFESLDEVLGFLNDKLSLGLSKDDQRAIIEYLKTL